MAVLEPLRACAGSWRGTNRLHDPHTGRPDDTAGTALVTPLLGGRFVRLDYTWVYRGAPQEGSLLIGYDAQAGAVTAHWIDSWHMSDKVMACTGSAAADGTLDLRGSYAAPPGPDWGWRTVIAPAGSALRMTMYNVTPDGQEAIAVEANYARVA